MSAAYIHNDRLLTTFDKDTRDIINIIQTDASINLSDNEKLYIHTIVSGFKAIGVWTKIKALYGFVGGTAATHRWNWKDMRDLDVAYRITFEGTGWIHSTLGSKSTSGGYIRTYLSLGTNVAYNSFSMGYYGNDLTNSGNKVNMGTGNSGAISVGIEVGRNSTLFGSAVNDVRYPVRSSKGLYGLSINTSDSFGFNNSQQVSIPVTVINTVSSPEIYINTLNQVGDGAFYSINKYATFAYIAPYLTRTESLQMSNIITFAQGILGRQ